ncbi:MAG TPA: hypothetical protein VHP37_26560 [Burkholderiales bacterium]|nr:hypothetical protein [Burkholderiales bacterium]
MSLAAASLAFLDGMSRCAKERYRVQLLDEASGETLAVASPYASYYADPFLLVARGERWLFVEEFHCPSNRAHISAMRVGENLRVGEAVLALDPGCHTSFPFVFEHDGAVYLLPETSQARSVDLYVCEGLPDRWRLAQRLLSGVDCADSVLLLHGGVWYLVTSQADEGAKQRRALAIYWSETLLSGHWTPHPVNRRRLYADRPHGYGRNAGAIVRAGDDLLRPMQASTRYYGEAASLMRIDALTPERYAEAPYAGEHATARIAALRSTHHVSAAGGLVAWDTRTHTGWFTRDRT